MKIPLVFKELSGIARAEEPITLGMPFSKGVIRDLSMLRLVDSEERSLSLQAEILGLWNDGSIKWALCDFQATVQANSLTEYYLDISDTHMPHTPGVILSTVKMKNSVAVDTGTAKLFLNVALSGLFEKIEVDGINILDKSKIAVKYDTALLKSRFLEKANISMSKVLNG